MCSSGLKLFELNLPLLNSPHIHSRGCPEIKTAELTFNGDTEVVIIDTETTTIIYNIP
jgi:hypothetical protein